MGLGGEPRGVYHVHLYEESFGYTVRATADGGCVFTGHTTVNSAGAMDIFLVGVEGMDR